MIVYKTDADIGVDTLIELYVDSTLGERRPVGDRARMKTMLAHANLIVSAWDGELLVGVSRCITDWVWTTYLADLAVRRSYQKQGIGKELMRRTQAAAPEAKLLLLAAPAAREYYPHVGFSHMPHAWWLLPGQRITND
jgi:GNAT superfamily N-acetyltransferase